MKMNERNIFLKYIKNPFNIILFLESRGVLNFVSDKLYLQILYYSRLGKKLNLRNPKTYNEKLQWLKLYDRNPKYAQMVDKFEVRNYVSNVIGGEYLSPLLGVWGSFDEIDFEKLPNRFVLKCTHDSGGLIICRDKGNLDLQATKIKINNCLKQNYYLHGREWPYKNVKPRIICEKFIEQENGSELRDYRFFCFNGEPKFITVDFSITNKEKTRRNLYDLDWNLMDEEITYPKELTIKVNKPEKFDEMIILSKKISADFPHARVDFYYIEGKIIFGELTFFHQSGMGKIRPEEFDREMGEWLQLPNIQK